MQVARLKEPWNTCSPIWSGKTQSINSGQVNFEITRLNDSQLTNLCRFLAVAYSNIIIKLWVHTDGSILLRKTDPLCSLASPEDESANTEGNTLVFLNEDIVLTPTAAGIMRDHGIVCSAGIDTYSKDPIFQEIRDIGGSNAKHGINIIRARQYLDLLAKIPRVKTITAKIQQERATFQGTLSGQDIFRELA